MAGPSGAGTSGAATTGWHPTVVNLLVLVAVELAAYTLLRHLARRTHIG
jgi:hypothetical protein